MNTKVTALNPNRKVVEVCMTLERETKGALRYQEIDAKTRKPLAGDEDGALLVNQYIRKAKLNGDKPTDIIVTITYVS